MDRRRAFLRTSSFRNPQSAFRIPLGGGMQAQVATSEELRQRVAAAIDEHGPGIVEVSDQIHKRPEIGFEERFASQLLADSLRRYGFEVEKPLGGLETAFRATKRGKGPGPTVAVLAEYDALPGSGHGCGHNLIGASG